MIAVVSKVATAMSRREKPLDLLEQGPRLQAGEQKDEAFDQVDDQIPEEDALQTRRRAEINSGPFQLT